MCIIKWCVCVGDLFFDKAVNGFLRELFERWKEAGCNHDVTIVFFWRLHYDPASLSMHTPYTTIDTYMHILLL